MDEAKKIDKRDSLRVVTDNALIDAQDMGNLSLNARKLFYVAVSQCKRNDKEFYEYETTPAELAEMWGVNRQQVYQIAEKTCKELMKIVINIRSGKKRFEMRHLFEKCSYDDNSILTFKLHNEMTDLLLGLRKDFSKPLIWDFMKMRSPYSMALWHLFQKEMHSYKPMMSECFEFDLTLEELRHATGAEDKLKSISEFKRFVLDKALIEIKKNCGVDITYINLKRSRTVIGFHFTAVNSMGHYNIDDLPDGLQKKLKRAELIRKKADRTITPEEFDELNDLERMFGEI